MELQSGKKITGWSITEGGYTFHQTMTYELRSYSNAMMNSQWATQECMAHWTWSAPTSGGQRYDPLWRSMLKAARLVPERRR